MMQHRPKELCQLAATWSGTLPDDGWLWQEKVDGWRALYLRDHKGQPRLFTRNGHPIEGTGHITWRLAQIEEAAGEPMMFDGEFQVGGSLEATKRWCESGHKAGGEAGQLFLFDAIPLSDWERGQCSVPQVDRLQRLREAIAAAEGDGWDWRPGSRGRDEALPPVVMLEDGWCFTPSDVTQEARRIWARKGEGLMLKDPLAPYQRNRSDAWQKVKPGAAWQRKLAA